MAMYIIKVDDILLTGEQAEQVAEILCGGRMLVRNWKDKHYKEEKDRPINEKIVLTPISVAQLAAIELASEDD